MTDPIDELISTATARTTSVRVFARGELVEAHAAAVRALGAHIPDDGSLAEGDDPRLVELAEEVERLQEQMETSAVDITITTVGAESWANLLRQNPPTAEDRRAGYDHNQLKFPPAAVAACSVEPKISPAQARQLMEKLHPGEWNKLWLAVYALNATETPLPKLEAVSELLRAKRPSAPSSAPEGSLALPSSDGDGERSPGTTTTTSDA